MAPSSAATRSIITRTSSSLDTSVCTQNARPPPCAMRATAPSAAYRWREWLMATTAPRRANASADANPMPEPPPVTIATVPVRSLVMETRSG
jgi:hypothetical protein